MSIPQLLVVRLGREEYGLPVETVDGIEEASPITPVPGSVRFVLGIYSAHGALVAVVDLAAVLGLSLPDRENKPFFIRVRGGGLSAALRVDEAIDVVSIEDNPIEPLGEDVKAATASDMLLGQMRLRGGLIGVLNVARLLESVAVANRG